MYSGFTRKYHSLLLFMPATATELLPQGQMLDAWRNAGRLIESNNQ